MNSQQHEFKLSSAAPDQPAPVLVGAVAKGQLHAVLFELTLRHTYRNTHAQPIEVVYTMALPAQATLLGFASELKGERRSGVIVQRHRAEQRYEQALEEGDTPVMLEATASTHFVANLGNLKPGEEIVLETQLGQLMSFEQRRLRVAIPTTMPPRYGDSARSGLQPLQRPTPSLTDEHAFSLELVIDKVWAGATTECPTHRVATRLEPDGSTLVKLAPGALMDRDVVVLVQPPQDRVSLFAQAEDRTGTDPSYVAMAALQPKVGASRKHIDLRILIDCSGSMAGDSMASAQAALRGLLKGLTDGDTVSLSRFGTATEHVFSPTQVLPQTLRYMGAVIANIQADLGGTELESALGAVYALPTCPKSTIKDVLLITDGQVWNAQEMVEEARASGHRIFAIGVGSAATEGVLRELAEATGGACEFATPGESLERAAMVMLSRIRQPSYTGHRLDWGCGTDWAVIPTQTVFGGDTAFAVAGSRQPFRAASAKLLAIDDQGCEVTLAEAETEATVPDQRLVRMAAAKRLPHVDREAALGLALRHRLVTDQTSFILVHERRQEDKVVDDAAFVAVKPMLAAGWGGTGSTQSANQDVPGRFSKVLAPSATYDLPDFGISFSRRTPFVRKSPEDLLAVLVSAFATHLASGCPVADLAQACANCQLPHAANDAILQMLGQGLDHNLALMVLAYWAANHSAGPGGSVDAHVIERLVRRLDPEVLAAGMNACYEHLGPSRLVGGTSPKTSTTAEHG